MEPPEAYAITDDVWMVPCRVVNNEIYMPTCKPFPEEVIENCSTLRYNWNHEEDQLLCILIEKSGAKNWTRIAKSLNNQIHKGLPVIRGKQCRERWMNHLDPDLLKTKWTEEEDAIILKKQLVLGNRWSDIAKCLTGRTENQVKNRWKSLIKKAKGLQNEICRGLKDEIAIQIMPNCESSYFSQLHKVASNIGLIVQGEEILFNPTIENKFEKEVGWVNKIEESGMTLRLSSLTSDIDGFQSCNQNLDFNKPGPKFDLENIFSINNEFEKLDFDPCLLTLGIEKRNLPNSSQESEQQWINGMTLSRNNKAPIIEPTLNPAATGFSQRTFQDFMFEYGLNNNDSIEGVTNSERAFAFNPFSSIKSDSELLKK